MDQDEECTKSKFLDFRFTLLFLQYAQKRTSSSTSDSPIYIPNPAPPKPTECVISVFGLMDCLAAVGPAVKEEQAKDFIYEYDSTLRGGLGLQDFLELMNDYLAVLRASREAALRFYKTQYQLDGSGGGGYDGEYGEGYKEEATFIDDFPTVESYYASLNLEDPMQVLKRDVDPVTRNIQDAFWIDDARLLNRHISIRIFGANNIQASYRMKRRDIIVDYESLDPFVRVKCAGTTVDTTIIIGSARPTWEQTLEMIVKIPKGSISDIQQWVQIQNIEFFVYDSNESCGTRAAELIYYASVPLIRVLLSTARPLNALIELIKLDCQKSEKGRPELEVSFVDKTVEEWSWVKVVDAYLSSEDIWLMKYADKIKDDLGALTLSVQPTTIKTAEHLTEKIWKLFMTTLENLKHLHPTRHFSLILLDEYNKFRFLPSFIKPIGDLGPNLETLDDIAKAVSSVPFDQTSLAPQWGTQEVIADHGKKIDYLASWLTAGKPGTYATETFVGQTAQPSSMLIRKRGNLIEHALLLCSIFRGSHVNAYVAIGEDSDNPVLSKSKIPSPPSTSEYEEEGKIHKFNLDKFLKKESSLNELAFKNSFSVLHWDPLSGECFESLEASSIPFDCLTTLFNEKNMWFNVQSVNHVRHALFSWDLESRKDWVPFLTEEMIFKPGQIQCPYSIPTFTDQFEYSNETTEKNHDLVTELVDLIQLYRRNVLFIPETYFYRPVCRIIQLLMDSRSAGVIPIRYSKDTVPVAAPASILGNIAAMSFDMGETEEVDGKTHVCAFNGWWSSKDPVDSLDQVASEVLPPRHFWNGHVLQFHGNDKVQIFEQLVASGLLDVSIPDTLFAIGVEIQIHLPLPFIILIEYDIYMADHYMNIFDPSADNNSAIRFASQNGYLDDVEFLLEDSRVDGSVIRL